jgi:hypothetical protein
MPPIDRGDHDQVRYPALDGLFDGEDPQTPEGDGLTNNPETGALTVSRADGRDETATRCSTFGAALGGPSQPPNRGRAVAGIERPLTNR